MERVRPHLVPLLVLAAWVAVVLALAVLQQWSGREMTVCLFKRATGIPCATCGGTRCAIALAKGDFIHAIRLNPLVAFLLVTAPLWIAVWVYRRRRRSPPLGAGVRRTLLVLFLTALALNWWYVIAQGRY